jgi:hypothetical protein
MAGPLFAQDRLEHPVTAASTSTVVNLTFTLGSRGYLDDLFLQSGFAVCQTGAVVVVNSTLNFTNVVGTWTFTNQSLNRITDYPLQYGDIVRVTFTGSLTNINNTAFGWFKNVTR